MFALLTKLEDRPQFGQCPPRRGTPVESPEDSKNTTYSNRRTFSAEKGDTVVFGRYITTEERGK